MFDPMQNEYFDCQCNDSDHTLRFILDPNDGTLFTEIHLRPQIWYERIWKGIKYIFGYPCKYGYWDCTHLKHSEYDKLRNLLDKSEKINLALPENERSNI
jgi:hypothetical protein